MSIDASRKHGPFDIRWPSERRDGSHSVATPALLAADFAEAPKPPRLRLVPTEPDRAADDAGSELAGAQALLAAVAAVQAWEGEGGYSR